MLRSLLPQYHLFFFFPIYRHHFVFENQNGILRVAWGLKGYAWGEDDGHHLSLQNNDSPFMFVVVGIFRPLQIFFIAVGQWRV